MDQGKESGKISAKGKIFDEISLKNSALFFGEKGLVSTKVMSSGQKKQKYIAGFPAILRYVIFAEGVYCRGRREFVLTAEKEHGIIIPACDVQRDFC